MLTSALKEIEAAASHGRPWLQTYAVADVANTVDRERFEAALDKIRERIAHDPALGLFGPRSMMWKISGEQATNIGALRMLLLQTAHPFIAHAVQQKSAYRTDPQGRHERTFRAANNWIFGDVSAAFDSARTVFRVHTHIVGEIANRVGPYDQGDRYAANEQRSQLWVHATGADSAVRLYEHIYGPLSRDERRQYHEENKLFWLLFGIDEALMPPTYEDFQEYVAAMLESDVLTPDQASRDIARYVMSPPNKSVAPVFDWLKIMTAGLLPARIRHGYQLPWGRIEKNIFEASMKAIRASVPHLPAELRYSFHYRRAMHRAQHTQPGRFERRVNRAFADMEKAALAKAS